MKRILILFLLALATAAAQVATFSIVAYDPVNGDWGVTVASRYFSVGSVVPWAEAGVGAVATQANVNVGYGPRALELLRQGRAAEKCSINCWRKISSKARTAGRWPSSMARATSPPSLVPTLPTGRATVR